MPEFDEIIASLENQPETSSIQDVRDTLTEKQLEVLYFCAGKAYELGYNTGYENGWHAGLKEG